MISHQVQLAFDQTTQDLEDTLLRLEQAGPGLLQRFFETIPDIAGVADFNGRILLVNKAVKRMLGYTVEEFTDTPYKAYVHPDDIAKTVQAEEILQNGDPLLDFCNRYRRKDGSHIVLCWRAVPDLHYDRIYFIARKVRE